MRRSKGRRLISIAYAAQATNAGLYAKSPHTGKAYRIQKGLARHRKINFLPVDACVMCGGSMHRPSFACKERVPGVAAAICAAD